MRRTFWLAVLLVTPIAGMACPKGSVEWHGDCAVDIQPEIAKPVVPSDEKPPSDKMPSYQREDVKLVDAPNMRDEDAKADLDRAEADKEGRQRAGIKSNKVAK